MKFLVPLAILCSGESFSTARPLALEWFLLAVRTQMASEIEAPDEGTSASRDGADKFHIRLPPPLTNSSHGGVHNVGVIDRGDRSCRMDTRDMHATQGMSPVCRWVGAWAWIGTDARAFEGAK